MENYKTVCDKCGKNTWYEEEQQCHCSYFPSKTCDTCGHTETFEEKQQVRCTGTLRKILNKDLNPSFTQFYESKQRIEVSFKDKDGKEYERKRGTIGKTTGWQPCYLLMLRRDSIGSSYTIGKNDSVVRIIA